MNDQKLIVAVARRLGWEHCPGSSKDWPDGSRSGFDWKDPEGIARSSDYADKYMLWLTSVDAALSVLDKTHLKIQYTVKYGIWGVVYKKMYRGSNKSLPSAILLAFLEAPHE